MNSSTTKLHKYNASPTKAPNDFNKNHKIDTNTYNQDNILSQPHIPYGDPKMEGNFKRAWNNIKL